jgi:hypothetical protein
VLHKIARSTARGDVAGCIFAVAVQTVDAPKLTCLDLAAVHAGANHKRRVLALRDSNFDTPRPCLGFQRGALASRVHTPAETALLVLVGFAVGTRGSSLPSSLGCSRFRCQLHLLRNENRAVRLRGLGVNPPAAWAQEAL